MEAKKVMKYRLFLAIFMILGVVGIIIVYYYGMLQKIPDTIYIKAGQEEHIDFDVPVCGEICKEVVEAGTFSEHMSDTVSIPVDFQKEQIFFTNRAEAYQLKLRLFGVFPYKDVKVEAVEEREVIPLGTPIGIYIKMDGILVIDTGSFLNCYGVECAPSQGILESGDYIVSVNGVEIDSKRKFIETVETCRGEILNMQIRRGDRITERMIFPQKDTEGNWKVGLWIRDSIQGIGTLTYVDYDGHFAALGHGVTDCDTNELVEIAYGNIYTTRIISIEKGEAGEPGGITGVIEYTQDNIKGDIVDNTTSGIGGVNAQILIDHGMKTYGIGYKQDAYVGKAQIISAVDGERKLYDVQITEINYNNDNKKREIALEVIDPELIQLTGGIVQGMSGSPIIQEGKLIGAITHVMVKNPRKGYGIFVENMLIMR